MFLPDSPWRKKFPALDGAPVILKASNENLQQGLGTVSVIEALGISLSPTEYLCPVNSTTD